MKLSEVTAKVIPLARAVRTYWDEELPKRHPDYPIIHTDEYAGPKPPEEAELKEFLTSLSPEMIRQVALLMYLGRGDFGTADLAEQFEQLKGIFDKPEWAVPLVLKNVPLADQLMDGLDKLKRAGINPDKLFAKASKTRN